MAAPPASAIRARSPSRSARPSPTMIWSRSACFRATAISKAGCRPTAAPITSPRRRLVVAYALKGTVRSDMVGEPIGTGTQRPAGVPEGHLADQRRNPRADRRRMSIRHVPHRAMPTSITATSAGARSRSRGGATYAWPAGSTYIQNPPYFTGMTMTPTPPGDIVGARALAVFGDSITTDHISPAGRDQARQPGRPLPARARVSRGRVQQLWRAPRQP